MIYSTTNVYASYTYASLINHLKEIWPLLRVIVMLTGLRFFKQ